MTLAQGISRLLFWGSTTGLVIMTLAQLLGRHIWQLELITHYVPHLAVCLLLTVIIYPKPKSIFSESQFFRFQLPRYLLLLLGLGVSIWSLHPLSLLASQTANTSTDVQQTLHNRKPLSIAYQNVNINHPDPESVIQGLFNAESDNSKSNSARNDNLESKASESNTTAKPDIMLLVEAGGANWQATLSKLTNHYPIHCGASTSSPFAMQLYAKDIAAICEIIDWKGYPIGKLTITTNPNVSDSSEVNRSRANNDTNNDKETRIIYVVHPPPPMNENMAQARNDYLSHVATLINADRKYTVLIVGDLNLSAFSPIYRHFIAQSITGGTSDAQATSALLGQQTSMQRTTLNGIPTWRPLGIGIDHVLIYDVEKQKIAHENTDTLNVKTRAQGWYGSDHRSFRIDWY